MKLVIYPAIDEARLSRVRDAAGEQQVCNAIDEQTALQAIVDADAFFGKITPALLGAATRLQWVQSPTASLEHYVFPELAEHPCTLTNMRGLFSDVIADHVFGFVLCFARNLHIYISNQTQRRFAPVGGEDINENIMGGQGTVNSIDRAHMHLADHTLGIVGFGAIGQEIARRAVAFNMRVLAVDPRAQELATNPLHESTRVLPLSRMDELLKESDFVVIAAPHTPNTVKMFGLAQFHSMKDTAYLINVGRGVIVDLESLVAALRDGVIAGAALDVFETEPLPVDHPLWQMDNVLITPHVASASPRIADRHLGVLLENITRFRNAKTLKNIADKSLWY